MGPEQIFTLLIMKFKSINYKTVTFALILVLGLSSLILLKLNESGVIFSGADILGIGKPAPDFTYPGLDGKRIGLSDHIGKVVLVNIWATWCRPCVDEMPSMEKLYQILDKDDFEILAISIDALGADDVKPFMQKYNLTFPVLLDPEGTIKPAYQVTGVPESFIINRQGVLAKKIIGAADWDSPEVVGFFRNLIQQSSGKD